MRYSEFQEAYDYQLTFTEEVRYGVVRAMKEWLEVIANDINGWKIGREDELPFLLKIFVSSEEELLLCLKNSKCESI